MLAGITEPNLPSLSAVSDRVPPEPVPAGLQRAVLIASSLSVVVVMLNVSIVNPSLPTLGHVFGVGAHDVPWVANVYNIVFAATLLAGGLLGDRFGFRRALVWGLALGVVGAATCALAPSFPALLVGRALQGLSSAVIQPATLVLLTLAFTQPAARARAIGVWAGVSGLGIAAGPLLGGTVIDTLGWSAVFWTVAVTALGTLAFTLGRTRPLGTPRPRPIDVPGVLLAASTLAGLAYGLSQGNVLGWGSAPVLGCLGLAAVTSALFLRAERRAPHPLVDLRVFRNRAFTTANVGSLLAAFGPFGLLVFITLFLQGTQGYSATRAGLVTSLFPIGVGLSSPLGGRLIARAGARGVGAAGLAVIGAGLLLVLGLHLGGSPLSLSLGLAGEFFVMGVGTGLANAALTTAAVSDVPAGQAAQASSVLSAMRQVGVALGIAAWGALVARGGEGTPGFLSGLHAGAGVIGALLLVGALGVWRGLTPRAAAP
ncbi:MFS transporter [Deinococcus knuensis]|uniref:MFS transporter n=1 Tax=Deinococcus knuensis TaxID=1837380 RepID=A0ABQ2SSI4_9DEIO|nr:MFS transporter [Deinococcus knuensis]